jgi:hypothetical protein
LTDAGRFPGKVVFGGPLSPVGWSVGFVEAPLTDVIEAIERHEAWLETTDPMEMHMEELRRHGVRVETSYGPLAPPRTQAPDYRRTELRREPILEQLARLDPLQTPPMRELVVAHGESWTANFTNDHLGGDSVSWVSNRVHALECRGVIATHIPVGHYRYPATQLELLGPGGDALGYLRTISAGIFDEGTWRFDANGEAQPFEDVARYDERPIRDRLDRALLLRYLAALGLDADNPDSYREAILFETIADWRPRTTSIAAVQREYGISGG